MYKVKCVLCGRTKMSKYKHDVCKCLGSMHHKEEISLLKAMENRDNKLIKKIMERAEKGEMVRII